MPISQVNPDGTVNIYNSKTGEVRNNVPPEQLSAISPKLVGEYQEMQSPENKVARLEAEQKLSTLEKGGISEDLKRVQDSIQLILQRYHEIPDSEKGPIKGNIGGAIPYVSPKVQAYNDLVNSTATELKEFVGETGVMTNQDVDRIIGRFPRTTAVPERARINEENLLVKAEELGMKLESPYKPQTEEKANIAPSTASLPPITASNTNPPENKPPVSVEDGQVSFQLPKIGDVAKGALNASQVASPYKLPMQAAQNPQVQDMFKLINPGTSAVVEDVTSGQLPSGEEAVQAGMEVGTGALGLLGGAGIAAKAPRVLKPLATAKTARSAAVDDFAKAGGELTSKELQSIAKTMLKDNIASFTEKPLLTKLAKGGSLNPKEGMDLLIKIGGKTFTKGGDFKTNQAADYYGVLREGLRSDFMKKAPKVIEETTKMAKALPKSASKKEPIQRFLDKAIFPAAIGGAAAMGVGALGRKIGLSPESNY